MTETVRPFEHKYHLHPAIKPALDNPYIPQLEEKTPSNTRYPFRHSPPGFRVVQMTNKNREITYAISDDSGRILTKRRLGEIIDAVQTFYDQVSTETIKKINWDSAQQEEERYIALQEIANRKAAKHPLLGCVYLVKSGPYYKIGHSKNVRERIEQLSQGLPYKIELVCTIETEKRGVLERKLHKHFESKKVHGEWFALEDSDVNYIKGLNNDIAN